MWFDFVSSFIWKVWGFGGDCGVCCCSFCFGGWLLWLRLFLRFWFVCFFCMGFKVAVSGVMWMGCGVSLPSFIWKVRGLCTGWVQWVVRQNCCDWLFCV